MTLKLHNFFRSSSSTRLRAALNLKGLAYEQLTYVLREGETRTPKFLSLNPQGLVPVLETSEGKILTQSLAILEWLEEIYPQPALLPVDPDDRARVRSLAYMIACEIHPLNNLRVLGYLGENLGIDDAGVKAWFVHWVSTTFDALEATLARDAETGNFCHGDGIGFADICLYAQVWNNRRFGINTATWPTIAGIFDRLDTIPAFRDAAPPNQPDAV
ncbi:maleylacetoacetate isomerase [Agrobacterium salinitolerans]